MTPSIYDILPTPIGPLTLIGDGDALTVIGFPAGKGAHPPPKDGRRDSGAYGEARRQLAAYFAGDLTRFDLKLAPQGTPFQQTVWRELALIPYGQTLSYGAVAGRIGKPKASRAVGLANGANPLPIVVPCHRVIGAGGALTGFGGGLPTKRYLLALERGERPLPL